MIKFCQKKYLTLILLCWKLLKKKKRKNPKSNIKDQQDFFTKATLNYLQKLIKDGRRGFSSKIEEAQLMYSIYRGKLDEADFQIWLVDALKQKDRNELIMFLSYSADESSATTPWGHKLFCISELAYNFCIHRSNGWHFINISKENILLHISDIQDSHKSIVETKKLQTTYKNNNQGSTNLILTCTDFCTHKMVLNKDLCMQIMCA